MVDPTTTRTSAAPEHLPLLEREAAMGQLRQALADVRAGRGRCVVIRGGAGFGKSRLVATLADEVAAERSRSGVGVRWLQGASDALHTPRPLGPLVDLAPALPGFIADALHAARTYNGLFPSLLA